MTLAVSSFEPYQGCSEVYRAEEGNGCLVVTGGYCPVMFKLFKEVLDQMARFVEGFVIVPLNFSVGFRRYHNLFSGFNQRCDNARIRIIALIGQQNRGFKIADQMIRAIQVAGLSTGQEKPERVAQSIACRMDFGA